MDKWTVYKKTDDFRVAAPKSVLDVVEIKSIDENGIFEVGRGGVFTKTYKIADLNYETASVDEQIAILESWCRWLNSNSAPFKITFNNKNKNMATMRREVLLGKKMDDFDVFRDMFNEEIEDKITNGRQGIEQELYLTVRYDVSNSYENAKTYFSTLENSMMQSFREIGSRLNPLDATERLRILHDFYRFGNEEYFEFDFRRAIEQRFDFKDAIINTRLDFSEETYFKTDDKYCSCIYLKQLPGQLTDRFLVSLSNLPVKMMCSIDAAPIADKDADDMLKGIYLGIEDRIRKQNNRDSDISLDFININNKSVRDSDITNEFLDELAKLDGISITAQGPYGRFENLKEIDIFKKIAENVPNASFEGEIRGGSSYDTQELIAKLENKLLQISISIEDNSAKSGAWSDYFSKNITLKKFKSTFKIDGEDFDKESYLELLDQIANEYDGLSNLQFDDFADCLESWDLETNIDDEKYYEAIEKIFNELEIEDSCDFSGGWDADEVKYTYDPVAKKEV